MKTDHIPALTGLRALAALLVYFCHFPLESIRNHSFDFQRELYIGVCMFFVLSGFLITLRYFNNFNKDTYFINRFARIYPVYFFLLLITYLVAPISDRMEIFLNFTLLKAQSGEYAITGIPQAWTLTVEEFFYASAPLMFICLKKHWTIPFFIAIGFGVFCQGSYEFFNYETPQRAFVTTFFGRFFEFYCGMILARAVIKKSSFPQIPYTAIGVIGIIWIVCAETIVKHTLTINGEHGFQATEGVILNNFICPIFVVCLIYGLINEESLLKRALSNKYVVFLGKASYSFYLVHVGVIQIAINDVFMRWETRLALTSIVAVLLYLFIEKPANKWIKSLRQKHIVAHRFVEEVPIEAAGY